MTKKVLNNYICSETNTRTVIKNIIVFLLCFYIFYIPSMSYTSKLNTLAYFILPVLTIFVAIYLLRYSKIDIRDLFAPVLFLVIFFLYAFVSTLFGERNFSSLPRLYLVLLSAFVIFGSLKVFNSPRNAIIVMALSMFAFVLFYFGYSFIFYRNRLFGWIRFKEDTPLTLIFFNKIGLNGGGGPNIISSYFGSASILFLYLSLFNSHRLTRLFCIPYFICLFAGITTGSRQFIIGIVIVSALLLFVAIYKNKILFIAAICALIIFFVLFMTLDAFKLIREPILNGFGLLENSRGDKSASSRLLMLIEAFEIGGSRLFLGFGADGFETVSGWGGYAHNTYANLYVSFGVFGLILYFAPLIIILIDLKRTKSLFFWLSLSLVIYYAIIGLFIVWYKDKIYFIAYGLILYFYQIRDNTASLADNNCELNI